MANHDLKNCQQQEVTKSLAQQMQIALSHAVDSTH